MAQTSTIEAIEKAICDAIQSVTGLTTINERRSGPQSSDSFASYRTLTIQGADYPQNDFAEVTEGFKETITDTSVIISQIKIIGKDAFSKLNQFCISLRSANRFVDLYQVVGLGGCGEVQSVPEELNGRQQEMAVVRIDWNAAIKLETNIDYFNKIVVGVDEPETDFDLELTIPKEIIV